MLYIIYLIVIPVIFFISYLIFVLNRENKDRAARIPVSNSYIKGLNSSISNNDALTGDNSDILIDNINWDDLFKEVPDKIKHSCLFLKQEWVDDEN